LASTTDDSRRTGKVERCPYNGCTFEGTEAEVDDHVVYVVGMDDPDHAPDKHK
jgi:hypothetical protein